MSLPEPKNNFRYNLRPRTKSTAAYNFYIENYLFTTLSDPSKQEIVPKRKFKNGVTSAVMQMKRENSFGKF